jgi:tetratricopeptide (TPR) repeat protein
MFRSLLAVLLLLGANTGHAQAGVQTDSSAVAADYTRQGVAAYKAANYALAAQDFQKAIDLESTPERHRDLGATYAAQVVPNAITPTNLRLAQAALDQFHTVLDGNPDDKLAIAQQAAILRNINELDKAKAVERTLLRLDPTNPQVPYTIGAIDWLQANQNLSAALAKEHLSDDGLGNTKMSVSLCAALATQNAPLVNDAVANLTRAIALKPDYADAMTYLSLILRRRADLHCADPVSVQADLDLASTWASNAKAGRDLQAPPPASAKPLLNNHPQ